MTTLNFIIESILFGFVVYSITQPLIPGNFKKDKDAFLDDVDIAATLLIRFAGIYSVLSLIVIFSYDSLKSGGSYEKYAFLNRAFGPYWYAYWAYIFAYFLLPQLLWMERFRKSKKIRLLLAILILFALSIERILLFVWSFHRDFIPSSWVLYHYGFSQNLILNRVIDLVVFGVFLWIIYLVRTIKKYA